MTNTKNDKIKPGIYRHYRGGNYHVVGIAKHSETLEDLVVYEALYENKVSKFWVRPLAEFFDLVDWKGKKVKRFTLISNLGNSKKTV